MGSTSFSEVSNTLFMEREPGHDYLSTCKASAVSEPCSSSFPPVCLSSLLWSVTSSPLQRGALYLAAHTPAGSHYSVNASAELDLPPSPPQMARFSPFAGEVGCFLKERSEGKGTGLERNDWMESERI